MNEICLTSIIPTLCIKWFFPNIFDYWVICKTFHLDLLSIVACNKWMKVRHVSNENDLFLLFPNLEHPCDKNPCENGGTCMPAAVDGRYLTRETLLRMKQVPSMVYQMVASTYEKHIALGYKCDCKPPYVGEQCQSKYSNTHCFSVLYLYDLQEKTFQISKTKISKKLLNHAQSS